MDDTGYILVFVTVSDAATGLTLGQALVDEGLAACVQVLPGGTAIYRWAGQTQVDPMAQLLIKTQSGAWPALQQRVLTLHADEVPEILAVPIQAGLPAYLQWMDEILS